MSAAAAPSGFDALLGQDLVWSRTGFFTDNSGLRAGGHVVATMRWEGFIQRRARVEVLGRRLTIEPTGLFSRGARVRAEGSAADVATYSAELLARGTLTLADGRDYRWGPLDFWLREWGWRRADSEPLVRVRPGFMARRGRVTIDASALSLEETPLLVALAWYLVLALRHRRGAH